MEDPWWITSRISGRSYRRPPTDRARGVGQTTSGFGRERTDRPSHLQLPGVVPHGEPHRGNPAAAGQGLHHPVLVHVVRKILDENRAAPGRLLGAPIGSPDPSRCRLLGRLSRGDEHQGERLKTQRAGERGAGPWDFSSLLFPRIHALSRSARASAPEYRKSSRPELLAPRQVHRLPRPDLQRADDPLLDRSDRKCCLRGAPVSRPQRQEAWPSSWVSFGQSVVPASTARASRA